MGKFKVFFIGPQYSGKTELLKQLLKPSYFGTAESAYKATVAVDFDTISINRNSSIQVWDSSGDPRYINTNKVFMRGTHVGICCINLSKEFTTEELAYTKSQLDELKKCNPHINLISKKLDAYKFQQTFSISTQRTNSSEKLRNLLIKKAETDNKILTARNRCKQGSDLYNALDVLNKEVQALKLEEKIIDILGEEAHLLLNTIFSPDAYNLETTLTNFVERCNQQLPSQSPLKGIIMSIAITAALTVMAGLIGFGIGFALGAWSGPGAFFSAIAVGKASAMGVLAATVSTCVIAAPTSYAVCRFYQSPIQKRVDEFAEEVKKADLSI